MQVGDFERTIEIVPIDIPEEEPEATPYEPEPVEQPVPAKEPAHV
jgi:hypothetical protein